MSRTVRGTYKTINGGEIQLVIENQSKDSLTISIINLNYNREKRKKLKFMSILLVIYVMYKKLLDSKIVFEGIFLIIFGLIIYQLLNLIKKDTLKLICEFGIQISTDYFMNIRRNFFLPSCSIHDIVINEVVFKLRVSYILIIRTKDEFYKFKPIIPLFTDLMPNASCLEVIYRELRGNMDI